MKKKHYFFLNLLYRINVLLEKKDNKGIVLILDDVVESFDYKNKYAILNYLFEFINDTSHYGENNKLIILSHNFDFIRTCQYHFRSGNETYLVKKDKNSKIIFNDFFSNSSIKDKKDDAIKVFAEWISDINKISNDFSDIENIFNLIALIPVIRNINNLKMQIQKSNILDKILHFHRDIIDNHNIKKNSEDFTWKDLDNELELFGVNTVKNSLIENDKVHNTVIKSCDYIKLNSKIIENKSVYYNLKLKIILTFGIRILLEKQMIMILEKNNIKIDWTKKLTTNQLHSKLRKLDKNINGKYDINLRQKVNKSLTLTNQVIHINSFMYEPLIDLDIQDLIKLYSESQIY